MIQFRGGGSLRKCVLILSLVVLVVLLIVSVSNLFFSIKAYKEMEENRSAMEGNSQAVIQTGKQNTSKTLATTPEPFHPTATTTTKTTARVMDTPSTNPDWEDISEALLASIDESVDPCENFYDYACGNFMSTPSPTPTPTLLITNETILKNFYDYACGNYLATHPAGPSGSNGTWGPLRDSLNDVLANALQMEKNGSTPWPKAVQQARIAFKTCLEQTDQDGNLKALKKEIKALGDWPMAGATTKAWEYESPEKLAGTLAGRYGINTFAYVSADPDALDPTKQQLDVSQAKLTYNLHYYTNNYTWAEKQKELTKSITKAVITYANATGAKIDNETLTEDVKEIVNLEHYIASICVQANQKRNKTKLYNPYNILKFAEMAPNVNMKEFLSALKDELPAIATNYFESFNVDEPSYWENLSKYRYVLSFANPRSLQNYLMWRFMLPNMELIPKLKEAYLQIKRSDSGADLKAGKADHISSCVYMIVDNMPYVAGRLYVDFYFNKLPGNPKAKLDDMILSVMDNFRLMLRELKWMTPSSKEIAINKVNGILRKVAFPYWILDNEALDRHLALIEDEPGLITIEDNLWMVKRKLKAYQVRFDFNRILFATNREEFGVTPAMVNAFYNPSLNAITFPAGILNPPFFHPNWPHSINYGGIGLVMGHELTHGFDDGGVQFDAVGKLMSNGSWMDRRSYSTFRNISKCIQKEYSSFCYPELDAPNCIDGVHTQGENIADNGGVKVAYYAYKQRQTLEGVPLRLPGPMSKYTHDQLFFLSLGHVWCRSVNNTKLAEQLLTNTHSPSRYRILGSLRNFRAFGGAFNCPQGSPMQPISHCDVW